MAPRIEKETLFRLLRVTPSLAVEILKSYSVDSRIAYLVLLHNRNIRITTTELKAIHTALDLKGYDFYSYFQFWMESPIKNVNRFEQHFKIDISWIL